MRNAVAVAVLCLASVPSAAGPARALAAGPAGLRATLSGLWWNDADRSGDVSAGDTLRYTARVSNAGTLRLQEVVFHDAPSAGIRLIPGSVAVSQGEIAVGAGDGDTTVTIDLGELAAKSSAEIRFDVEIASPPSAPLANQGFAAARGIPGVPTDDPGTLPAGDPTRLLLRREAALDAIETVALVEDADRSGTPTAGDKVRLTVQIRNQGERAAEEVQLVQLPNPGFQIAGSTALSLGRIEAGATVARSFDAVIRRQVPQPDALSAQGRITWSQNAAGVLTDDPATLATDDPTRLALGRRPLLSAAKSAVLLVDADGDGVVSPGDLVRYQLMFLNQGNAATPVVSFADTLDPASALAAGTVAASQGQVTTGNGPADRAVAVRLGLLPPGGSAALAFTAVVREALPAEVKELVNQGLVIQEGAGSLATDDPGTPQLGDATRTPLARPPVSGLSGRVWEDLDGDGVQETGEPPLAAVKIRLLDEAGRALASEATGTDGSYRFPGLTAGEYRVRFEQPSGWSWTPADRGSDETDSDADPATGQTAPVTLAAGASLGSLSGGLYRPASLRGRVWDDGDGDGMLGPEEHGMSDVALELLDPVGQRLAAARTDAGGAYRFDERAPGEIRIQFTAPLQHAWSPPGSGSAPDPATGRTAPVVLLSGTTAQVNAGLYRPLTGVTSSPASGERDIALERETILRFDGPLAATAAVDSAHLFAEFAGQRLAARLHLAPDRRAVTLFYQQPLPPSARVRVTLVGDGLPNRFGHAIDADGDGLPGGTVRIDFDTLSLTSLPGTRVCGRVFASELAPGAGGGSVNVPLEGVTIRVEGSDTLSAVTDDLGNYCLGSNHWRWRWRCVAPPPPPPVSSNRIANHPRQRDARQRRWGHDSADRGHRASRA